MSYATLDEAWPEGDFPSTYAVYGGLRPELNRPAPETDSSSCPTGFDEHDILPCSVPSLLSARDTFSDTKPVYPYSSEWMHNNHTPKSSSSRRRKHLYNDSDSDSGSISDSEYTNPVSRRRHAPECGQASSHLRECARCQERYLNPASGLFWWLEGRDAFIMIGGLILLTLLGILIKRS
jgi:hypothetical protein